MRSKEIKESYVNGGVFKDGELFNIGDQMAYEWEQDFRAMKWAVKRLQEFLDVANAKGHFTGTLNIAYNELVNRISKYSCPSNLKDEYKTKENCPLGENCKCCVVSDK